MNGTAVFYQQRINAIYSGSRFLPPSRTAHSQVQFCNSAARARKYRCFLLSQHLPQGLMQKLRAVITRQCCFREFSRLSQTFNTREYIARIHPDDAGSGFFTGRILINLVLCLFNFLILRDDLVCIIALKLSPILL